MADPGNIIHVDTSYGKLAVRSMSSRTDPKACRVSFTNLGFGNCFDQQKLVAETKVPTAVVIGTAEPHLDNGAMKSLKYGWLWGGKVIEIEVGEHCPLWEKPAEFIPVLEKFQGDVAG